MATKRLAQIEVGYQVFARGNEEEFGAVRAVGPREITVYVEDSGDMTVPRAAIVDVVEEKVIIDLEKMDEKFRQAVARAHRDEDFPNKR